MKLFLIQRTGFIGYDEVAGFVIAADRHSQARAVAIDNCATEGPDAWVKATCNQIGENSPHDKPTIILRDFRAG